MATQTQKLHSFGDLVTLELASRIKSVHYATLYKWVYRNNIETVKIGNTIMVKLDALNNYHPKN